MNRTLELRSGLVATAFDGHAGLAGCASDWEQLNAGSGRDPLCNRFDWAEAYAAAWVREGDLFGWRLTDDAGPVAVLAFRKEERPGRFDLGRARLVQDGSYDSDYLDPPVRPGCEAAVAADLFDLLAQRSGIQAAVLSPLDSTAPLLRSLRRVAQARRLSPGEEALICPSAPLAESFDGYLSSLKKRMRSKVRQAVRRVDQRGATFAWCDDPRRIEADLDDLYRLHAARWRDAGIPGAFADDRRRQFYRRLVDQHLPPGRLRFSRLELEGQTIACQFGVAV
ncbi:MAG: GNAT family N-acetyltransferase, partial [Planctomycetota bacterium]